MCERPMRSTGSLMGVVWLAATTFAPPAWPQVAESYSVELTGEQVGPTTGDPDGEGTAEISIRIDEGRLCYTLSVEDVAPPLSAHLHAAVTGRIGPIRLQFDAPIDGTSQGCVRADRDLLVALDERPQFFYIDVHTSEYPGAALRGQIGGTVLAP